MRQPVKLGDGAMLYFRDAAEGVRAAAELVGTLSADLGLPALATVQDERTKRRRKQNRHVFPSLDDRSRRAPT